jgi:hypothetical protein
MSTENEWKKCSACKKAIPYNSRYYTCSVSSCNTSRTNYIFCSVPCFDHHIPKERHKSAGAIDNMSPKKPGSTEQNLGARRIIPNQKSNPSNKQISRGGDVLIIASRLKEFILAQSEYSTSASVMDVLSDHVRLIAMQAIDNARSAGRKTVMEQDLKFLDKLNLNI